MVVTTEDDRYIGDNQKEHNHLPPKLYFASDGSCHKVVQ